MDLAAKRRSKSRTNSSEAGFNATQDRLIACAPGLRSCLSAVRVVACRCGCRCPETRAASSPSYSCRAFADATQSLHSRPSLYFAAHAGQPAQPRPRSTDELWRAKTSWNILTNVWTKYKLSFKIHVRAAPQLPPVCQSVTLLRRMRRSCAA